MAEVGGESKKFPWRRVWAAARYVAVIVVTVAAVATVAKTLSCLVFRPKQLRLVVSQGSVEVIEFLVFPPANLTLWLTLTAYNPTADDVTYSMPTVHLLDVSAEPPVVLTLKLVRDIVLESLEWVTVDDRIVVPFTAVRDNGRYVSMIYDGLNVQVAMRVEGELRSAPQSSDEGGATTRHVIYYCWPVQLGFGSWTTKDVSCDQVDD